MWSIFPRLFNYSRLIEKKYKHIYINISRLSNDYGQTLYLIYLR